MKGNKEQKEKKINWTKVASLAVSGEFFSQCLSNMLYILRSLYELSEFFWFSPKNFTVKKTFCKTALS